MRPPWHPGMRPPPPPLPPYLRPPPPRNLNSELVERRPIPVARAREIVARPQPIEVEPAATFANQGVSTPRTNDQAVAHPTEPVRSTAERQLTGPPPGRSSDGPVSTWKIAFLLALGAWWIFLRRNRRLAQEAERLSRQHRALQFANSRLQSESDELRQQAINDPLTGALNRLAFASGLRELIEHLARYRRPVHLILLDLDRFKAINDHHGHLVGDSALKLVTGVVHEHLDSADLFGRFGGDEFLIACADQDRQSVRELADRIRRAVIAAAPAHQPPLTDLTLSIGVASADEHTGYSVDALFARADAALYEAKHQGRNRVVVAHEKTPTAPVAAMTVRHL